ncbi:unnamed protein product [Didymodactylos carnosus]|uniref:Uncharacterized protein n=1 Tax=Didymodactylos carnosus TaxID=1234261 RepID=A0A8S2G0V1_9BILA|nr:unnamed protein product [Didymodactylos carnosus]CAF4376375.1 unnamed protein product [Didymodactylos carnosus]
MEMLTTTASAANLQISQVINESYNIHEQPSVKLSKDLISSYYTVIKNIKILATTNRIDSKQEEDHSALMFNNEWQKLDMLELQHDHNSLKQKHDVLNQQLTDVKAHLERTQAERDQLRNQNINLTRENDQIKNGITDISNNNQQLSFNTVVINNNIKNPPTTCRNLTVIDEVSRLIPRTISSDQAKAFIGEINRRRTALIADDLRRSICGSLKHLGSDLYSSSAHFLHELIQVKKRSRTDQVGYC